MKYWWRKMFYYRYRPGSELSIKELIYDELYFASRAECNDPYEGKSFAVFEKDKKAWDNLIRLALIKCKIPLKEKLTKKIVEFYFNKSPIYFDQFVNTSEDEFLSIETDIREKIFLKHIFTCIKKHVLLYKPEEQYFVSFSRRPDINLMWAHYANNHRGFCLIFRSIDGKINQNKYWKKAPFVYPTPNSFSPQVSFSAFESFKIKDVEYVTDTKSYDGFIYFPPYEKNKPLNIEGKKVITNDREKIYLQKHATWYYEEESRIILQNGISWLVGEQLSLSPHQRLFHYDPIHLAGIIVGVNMPQEQRCRIEEIMEEKARRQYECLDKEFIVSDLVMLEEKLSETNREPEIVPCKIYGSGALIDKQDKEFSCRYKRWEDGYVFKYTDRTEEIQLK